MELSNSTYRLVDQPDSLLARTENVLDSFDNCLNKITQTVEELNRQFLVFNAGLQLIYEVPAAGMNYLSQESHSETDLVESKNYNPAERYYDNDNGKKTEKEESGRAIKTLEGLHSLTDHTKKLVSVFEEFSPKIKRLGTVLESISNLSEGAAGVAKLFSAAETGITATEGIGAVAEIIAGATGVAEAGAAFGPPGWIVAGAALTVAGITAIVSDDEDKRKKKREKRKKDEEDEADYQRVLQTFQMTETQAGQYLRETEQMANKKAHPWKMHRNISMENLKKYEANTAVYEPSVALQKVDQLYQRQNIPPGAQYAIADQVKPTASKSFFEKFYEIELRLESIGRFKGRADFDLAVKKEIDDARRHDLTSAEKLTPMVRDAANQAKQNILELANENRVVADGEPEIKTKRTEYSVIQGNQEHGRMININLNRPMIEYFTINTNGVKEGIDDFKHKVEEALLEILSSANAIH